jgi:hypothetical protein
MSQIGSIPPGLPIPPNNSAGLLGWAAALVQHTTRIFGLVFHDLSQQPRCPEFTVATIPGAADWKGRIIFVSDGSAGAQFRASTGTAWVNLG